MILQLAYVWTASLYPVSSIASEKKGKSHQMKGIVWGNLLLASLTAPQGFHWSLMFLRIAKTFILNQVYLHLGPNREWWVAIILAKVSQDAWKTQTSFWKDIPHPLALACTHQMTQNIVSQHFTSLYSYWIKALTNQDFLNKLRNSQGY